MSKPIDQERRIAGYRDLAQRLLYADGVLIWRESTSWKKGMQAGREDALGYRRIHLAGVGMFACHRVIYFMHHGILPEVVDHIDGNCRNNRIDNLRAATTCQNMANCKTPSTNTSGVKGVYWHKGLGKWTASIRISKKLAHLGCFDTMLDAACARKSAEAIHYGEFAR